jgi:hypothetical protein
LAELPVLAGPWVAAQTNPVEPTSQKNGALLVCFPGEMFDSFAFRHLHQGENMKHVIAVIGLALLAAPVLAATEQQEKANACKAEASKKALKGDKRKAFIKNCVSGKAEAKPKTTAKPKSAAKPEAKTARPASAQPDASSAATPAAAPPTPAPASATDKKRLKCEELARQSNVAPERRKTFMDQCMAG